MPLPPSTATALTSHGISFKEDIPLAKRTWWRVGGPAAGFATVRDLPTLQRLQAICAETACPVFVLGNASNLLISDAGIPGLVLTLAGGLAEATALPERQAVSLGAGLKLVVAMKRAATHRWTGLEFFAGIPGTVGGAVRMNAGSTLGEVSDGLLCVEVVERNGTKRTLEASTLGLTYRSSTLPDGAVLTNALFRITEEDPDASQKRVEEFLARRKRTQPLDMPSCGSTFRNPPGDYAGRLIEAAGLKGARIGGAQISEKHANFFVNTGGATAADLRRLIAHAQSVVSDRFGVLLTREVHFAGDWSGWEP